MCHVLEPRRVVASRSAAATSWACQRNNVLGETSRNRRRSTGSSRLNALSSARSAQFSLGLRVVSAQYGDLVAEHQDLDILGGVGAGEQRQPAQDAGEHQVREAEGHSDR